MYVLDGVLDGVTLLVAVCVAVAVRLTEAVGLGLEDGVFESLIVGDADLDAELDGVGVPVALIDKELLGDVEGVTDTELDKELLGVIDGRGG